MRKQLAGLAVLTTVLIAAAPGPSPVITLDGVSKAARLSPEIRAAIAPHVKALNGALEKIVASQAEAVKAGAQRPTRMHEAMKPIHEQCHKVLHEIVMQLTPEQRAAFHEYLHAQMKAAGIVMEHAEHGPGNHPEHGQRVHSLHHGETSGESCGAAA